MYKCLLNNNLQQSRISLDTKSCGVLFSDIHDNEIINNSNFNIEYNNDMQLNVSIFQLSWWTCKEANELTDSNINITCSFIFIHQQFMSAVSVYENISNLVIFVNQKIHDNSQI